MPISKQPTKLCYVIMPFSKTKTCTEDEWTDIFKAIIKPAVEGAGLGYSCRRSEATTGNMIKKIVDALYTANIVIADLTDRNPNVFYELGVRHTLKNRTMLLAQRRKDIPSDLDGYASHVYKWKTSGDKAALMKKLRALLRHIEHDTDRSDNPVSEFLQDRSFRILEFQREENSRKLGALFTELGFIEDMLEILRDRMGEESVDSIMRPIVACPALDHFLATHYVLNRDFIVQATSLRMRLQGIFRGSSVSVDELADLAGRAAVLGRNTHKLMSALEAGDPLTEIGLDKFSETEAAD